MSKLTVAQEDRGNHWVYVATLELDDGTIHTLSSRGGSRTVLHNGDKIPAEVAPGRIGSFTHWRLFAQDYSRIIAERSNA